MTCVPSICINFYWQTWSHSCFLAFVIRELPGPPPIPEFPPYNSPSPNAPSFFLVWMFWPFLSANEQNCIFVDAGMPFIMFSLCFTWPMIVMRYLRVFLRRSRMYTCLRLEMAWMLRRRCLKVSALRTGAASTTIFCWSRSENLARHRRCDWSQTNWKLRPAWILQQTCVFFCSPSCRQFVFSPCFVCV